MSCDVAHILSDAFGAHASPLWFFPSHAGIVLHGATHPVTIPVHDAAYSTPSPLRSSQGAKCFVSRISQDDLNINHDVMAWYIDPIGRESGWPEHQDRADSEDPLDYITCFGGAFMGALAKNIRQKLQFWSLLGFCMAQDYYGVLNARALPGLGPGRRSQGARTSYYTNNACLLYTSDAADE